MGGLGFMGWLDKSAIDQKQVLFTSSFPVLQHFEKWKSTFVRSVAISLAQLQHFSIFTAAITDSRQKLEKYSICAALVASEWTKDFSIFQNAKKPGMRK